MMRNKDILSSERHQNRRCDLNWQNIPAAAMASSLVLPTLLVLRTCLRQLQEDSIEGIRTGLVRVTTAVSYCCYLVVQTGFG